jgi:ATP-binding cassette subfamily B (MDR/TAP) protein 1
MMIGGSFGQAFALLGDYSKHRDALDNVLRIVHRKPAIRGDVGVEMNAPVTGIISVENVSFAYPSRPDVTVLRGVDLLLETGTV